MNKLYNPETNTVYYDKLLEIPEFKALTKTPQNILWHKEGNAWVHTCNVTQHMLNYINCVDNLVFDYEYRKILVLSALLHDIGKPITTEKGEDGLYHCKNHAIKGVQIANNILNQYFPDLSQTSKEAILSLVRYHMQPLYILEKKSPEKAILKLTNDLKCISFESLLLLKLCDCKGSISEKDPNYEEVLEKVRKLYYNVCSYPSHTKVCLEKLKDLDTCNYSPGCHPNGINTGYITYGKLSMPITIGYRTYLGFQFSTSPVTKIIDKNHFQTKNSLYKITQVK